MLSNLFWFWIIKILHLRHECAVKVHFACWDKRCNNVLWCVFCWMSVMPKVMFRPWPADTNHTVLSSGKWLKKELKEQLLFAVKTGWSCELFSWLHRAGNILRTPGISTEFGGWWWCLQWVFGINLAFIPKRWSRDGSWCGQERSRHWVIREAEWCWLHDVLLETHTLMSF